MLAFLGAVSLLGVNAYGVSPVPLLPQESRTSAPINLKSFRLKTTIFTKRAFMKNKKTPHPIKDERSSFRGTTFVQLFHNK
jgi:hypothetical protein